MNTDNRYERQTALPELGPEGQERLARARVLLVGVGGLGCPAALYLTAAGIGTVGLMDDDIVSLSNLQRQVLYAEADQGQPKVLCAARRLRQLNSRTHIEMHPYRLTERNARELLEAYDIVVDGCDNFPTRYLLGDVSAELRKPYVYGAIRGLQGQVSVFNHGPHPRAYRELFPDEKELCALPVDKAVIGVTAGLTACVQATEALKIAAGFGEVLSGRLWTVDVRDMQTHLIQF